MLHPFFRKNENKENEVRYPKSMSSLCGTRYRQKFEIEWDEITKRGNSLEHEAKELEQRLDTVSEFATKLRNELSDLNGNMENLREMQIEAVELSTSLSGMFEKLSRLEMTLFLLIHNKETSEITKLRKDSAENVKNHRPENVNR
mmetsp:Transcript_9772/g.14679  ORF Transcript_9772/g.14679 Transcript_9772/m.14679 type:complete len:145 (-) Transcript_9772:356-790(-)